MAKKATGEGVYRVIDIIGTSTRSWEEATKNAVETATRSLRDLRIAEVQKLDVKIDQREDRRLSRAGPGLVQVRGLIGSGHQGRGRPRSCVA